MLRIAVPNKGSLSEPASAMLREAGYRTRRDSKELVLSDPDNDVEFFYLRPRDIAVYVGSGTVDAGVTGRDLLLDSGSEAEEIMALGFGGSTFRFAGRPGEAATAADLDGMRVATSYPGLVRSHLAEHGVSAEVVRLDGAVETAITLGVADAIADVVETGATLRSQGLAVFGDPILRSEAVLIRRADSAQEQAIRVLHRRLTGVVTARHYVMLDYDCPAELVERACALTPGLESPTVSPLQNKEWSAVRAMVPRTRTNAIMDELYELGARAILVTDIAACRL
ncbi:ATP phosphoribosyltransferase [Janibacter sp. G1551]|uniref:ATP phosphoribosyltransferase n=1 Tax=Janibacter sp. G1551 TaxID=3420440 RepID=UPI003D090661